MTESVRGVGARLSRWLGTGKYVADTPESLRRLVLALYALVMPPFLLALAATAKPGTTLPASLVIIALCCVGAAWTLTGRPSAWSWAFVGAIAPMVSCGTAFVASGGAVTGYLAVMAAPVAWSAILSDLPVVVAAVGTGTAVCLASVFLVHGALPGVASGALFLIAQGLVALVVFGRPWHDRLSFSRALERQVNDIELVVRAGDGQIVDANDRAVEAYGYTLDELRHLNVRALRRGDVERVTQQMASVTSQEAFRVETKHYRKDGSSLDVAVSSRRYTSSGTDYVLSLVRDVTEHVRLEQVAHEREERLRSVATAMAEGIVLQGADGRILECNPAAERILGLTRAQMEGRTSVDPRWRAIHDDGSPFPGETHPAMLALSTGDAVRHVVMGVHRGEHDLVWILINAEPLRGAAGEKPHAVVTTFTDITAMKNAEQRERALQLRLRRVVEGSNDGVWDCELATGRVEFNERWAAMLGYQLSEIEPTTAAWERLVHPDDLLGAWVHVRAHLDGTTDAFRFECRMRHKDGHWIWVLDRGRIVERDASGAPVRTAGTHTDITRWKEAERRERAAQERLARVLDGSREALIDLDLVNGIVHHSPALARILGREPSEIPDGLGAIVPFVHPDDLPRFKATFTAQANGEADHVAFEWRVLHRDGHWVWLQARHSVAERDEAGRPTRIAGTLADISHLKALEERLQLVIDGSNDGFWDWHVPSGAVHFSERWAAMLGYDVGELSPHVSTWAQLVHPDDIAPVTAALEAHLRGDTPQYETEHRARHKAGHWVWVLDRGKVVERDGDGRAIRAAGTHTDITARKDGEAALRESSDRNVALVGELRAALHSVKTLSGLLPICASCKKIRDDRGYWERIEHYITAHTDATFSHGLCPDCIRRMYPELDDTTDSGPA